MAWTERQQAMLAELGLRVWGAPAADEPELAPAVDSAVPPVATATVRSVAAPERALTDAAPGHPAPIDVVPNPSRAAGLDWPELRAAVAGCSACALCQERRQTVFGVGHAQAHWMIVGEAPGEREDELGEPFVGSSGRLLDNMLRALGLGRTAGEGEGEGAAADPPRQVYIANAVKCRPPGNRNPEPAELAACEPYLRRQIELVQPRVILAMGRFAVQSLLRSAEPVGRLRGKVHRFEGVPLVVTYHPAYLLRNPEDKARAWDDLCLAWEIAQSPSRSDA